MCVTLYTTVMNCRCLDLTWGQYYSCLHSSEPARCYILFSFSRITQLSIPLQSTSKLGLKDCIFVSYLTVILVSVNWAYCYRECGVFCTLIATHCAKEISPLVLFRIVEENSLREQKVIEPITQRMLGKLTCTNIGETTLNERFVYVKCMIKSTI